MGHRDDTSGTIARVRAGGLFGALAGAALSGVLLSCGADFKEEEKFREPATAAEVAEWSAQLERRGKPWTDIPDPPGDGPVVKARYWISRAIYEMEIRRRGNRAVVEIHGIDGQILGGGWTAFGEGAITGDPGSFRSAVARISWSCLGIRYRQASDGLAKITFSEDGAHVAAVYLTHEGMRAAEPDAASKAYGELIRGPRPPHGTIRGQIPFLRAMDRHEAGAPVTVSGRVLTIDGAPVPEALVQLKGVNATRTQADSQGRFQIEFHGRDAPWAQAICAGAAGFRNGETTLFTGDRTTDVVVELASLDLQDHREYRWVHPDPLHDPDDVMSCGTCHSWQYTEWLGSRHARMADHGHVLWERARMLEAKANAPDDCSACHQPADAASTGRGDYRPLGVLASNHCDFCHKILRTADASKPGVFGSLQLARPDPAAKDRPGGIHRVFGAAPDVSYAYMGASYNPYFATSWLCAGCHQGGGLPGRPKVDTFEEWRKWAAKREDDRFRECQDCHMPTASTVTVEGKTSDLFAWEALHRKPTEVHNHSFPGASKALAAKALDVKVAKSWDATGGAWVVTVALTNVGAGHSIPTGTWTKHVLVGVWAKAGETWLTAEPGPRAVVDPSLATADAPLAGGDWRNPPGTILGVFAKGETAPASFWAPPPTADTEDKRLAPGETRTLTIRFRTGSPAPGPEPGVEVRVVHRRGAIGVGVERTPWDLHPYDPAPETEWMRIVR